MRRFFSSIKSSFFYIILAIGLGVLWHYVYDWSGKLKILGLVFPVTESTWEHLKLLFYPVLILSILEVIFKRKKDGFIVGRTMGMIYGMISIIVLFYTYMGVVGIEFAPINIIIYIIGVFIAYGMGGKYYAKRSSTFLSRKVLCILILILFIIAFGIFAFYPPNIGLFISPE